MWDEITNPFPNFNVGYGLVISSHTLLGHEITYLCCDLSYTMLAKGALDGQ